MDEFSFAGPVDSDIHIFRMDNEALEVSPVTSRKPYTRSDTALSAVDLDILNKQKNVKVNDISVGTFQKIQSVSKNAPVAHCSRMLLEHFYLDAVYIIDTWIGTSINLSSDVEFTYSQ